MTRSRFACAALVLGLFASIARANELPSDNGTTDIAPCWASHCMPGSWGGVGSGSGVAPPYELAQVFVPVFTGVLEFVHLALWNTTTTQAEVEIRAGYRGKPSPVVMARATVPGAPYNEYGLQTASFAGRNITLQAGVEYAIVVRSTGSDAIGLVGSSYPCVDPIGVGGVFWTSNDGTTWNEPTSGTAHFVYRVCMSGLTPAPASSWGSVKLHYR